MNIHLPQIIHKFVTDLEFQKAVRCNPTIALAACGLTNHDIEHVLTIVNHPQYEALLSPSFGTGTGDDVPTGVWMGW